MPFLPDVLQAAVLTAFPHGGQHGSRRNAWTAMSSDAARARARREAAAALRAAELSAARTHAPARAVPLG